MRRGFLVALMASLLAVPSASAGTGGNWTPVTPDYNQNFNLAGLYRTADGVLHVSAQQNDQANPQNGDFIHVPISPGGAVGPASIMSADWVGTNSPDILGNPGGGLLSIWGGIHSTTTGDPLNNGTFATSGDGGGTWAADPNGPWGSGGTAGGTYVYAEQVSAENGADGTPYTAWAHDGVYVHRGLAADGNFQDYNAQIGGDTIDVPDLALDGGNGQLWLGWHNYLKAVGVYAQQVDQTTGAPVGSPAQMPGSVVQYQGQPESPNILGRTPITGRPGRPGVWMAYPVGYPSANKLLVWKVGDAGATTLATSTGDIHEVAITSDPDGRVIVAWHEASTGGKTFLRVSNTDVTAWGAPFAIAPPKSVTQVWALQASAQSGGLVDLVSNFSEGTGTPMRFWHTQAVAPPELAKSVDASVVSGVVLIKLPGSSSFVPLSHTSQIPVGATVDATKGRVRILAATPGGRTASSDFFEGVFQVTQKRSGVATMILAGADFGICGKAGKGATAAKAPKAVRHLWGAGKGPFATKGKYASAAIRGTTWLTTDRCDGTLIRVTQGAVTVRDFVTKKTVVVKKGHSYLAKAKR